MEKTINEKRLEFAVKREEEHQKLFKKIEKKRIKTLLEELKTKGYNYEVITYNYKTKKIARYNNEENSNKALNIIYKQNKHAMISVDIYTPFHMKIAVRIKGARKYIHE